MDKPIIQAKILISSLIFSSHQKRDCHFRSPQLLAWTQSQSPMFLVFIKHHSTIGDLQPAFYCCKITTLKFNASACVHRAAVIQLTHWGSLRASFTCSSGCWLHALCVQYSVMVTVQVTNLLRPRLGNHIILPHSIRENQSQGQSKFKSWGSQCPLLKRENSWPYLIYYVPFALGHLILRPQFLRIHRGMYSPGIPEFWVCLMFIFCRVCSICCAMTYFFPSVLFAFKISFHLNDS